MAEAETREKENDADNSDVVMQPIDAQSSQPPLPPPPPLPKTPQQAAEEVKTTTEKLAKPTTEKKTDEDEDGDRNMAEINNDNNDNNDNRNNQQQQPIPKNLYQDSRGFGLNLDDWVYEDIINFNASNVNYTNQWINSVGMLLYIYNMIRCDLT